MARGTFTLVYFGVRREASAPIWIKAGDAPLVPQTKKQEDDDVELMAADANEFIARAMRFAACRLGFDHPDCRHWMNAASVLEHDAEERRYPAVASAVGARTLRLVR